MEDSAGFLVERLAGAYSVRRMMRTLVFCIFLLTLGFTLNGVGNPQDPRHWKGGHAIPQLPHGTVVVRNLHDFPQACRNNNGVYLHPKAIEVFESGCRTTENPLSSEDITKRRDALLKAGFKALAEKYVEYVNLNKVALTDAEEAYLENFLLGANFKEYRR